MPPFGSLDPMEQRRRVAALLQQARSITATAAATAAPAKPVSEPALGDALGRLNCLSLGAGAAAASSSSSEATSCTSGCDPDAAPPPDSVEAVAVDTLCALCDRPPPEAFLLDVLRRRCGGNAQAAADWLLGWADSSVLESEVSSWEVMRRRQQAEREEASRATELARRRIVERYHLEPLPGGAAPQKRGADMAAWGASKGGSGKAAGSSMRYRDGAVVTTKGEKVREKRRAHAPPELFAQE